MKVLSPHSQNEIKLNFSDAYFLTNRKGRINTSLLSLPFSYATMIVRSLSTK